ncbi:MAG: hypothetical protein HUU37_10715, partial [Bdellovibrionales bacterium]|nr:hypothetical protein [Bdellovibrionales bacterium]
MNTQKNDQNLIAILWIALGTLGRLLPLPPNMTPMTSVALFGGAHLPRGLAVLVTLTVMVLSDALIAFASGHEVFGYWSIFTYSGFAAMVLAGSFLRVSVTAGRTASFLVGSSLGFWVWTNFGTWLVSGMYPLSGEGLMACYVAALPFLRNALVGDLAWGMVLFLGF